MEKNCDQNYNSNTQKPNTKAGKNCNEKSNKTGNEKSNKSSNQKQQ